jgi:hypothetical protein
VLGSTLYQREVSSFHINTREGTDSFQTDLRGLAAQRFYDIEKNREVPASLTEPRTLLVFISGAECASCLSEFSVWQQLAARKVGGLDLKVVMIRSVEQDARQFIKDFEPAFPILLDTHRTAENLNIPPQTPWKVVVDRDGRPLLASGPLSSTENQQAFLAAVLRLAREGMTQ